LADLQVRLAGESGRAAGLTDLKPAYNRKERDERFRGRWDRSVAMVWALTEPLPERAMPRVRFL
jgi:hypothetical protein